ncbi:T57 [Hirschfeldia incana]|nr:T57 [Hirschfeldia incana]
MSRLPPLCLPLVEEKTTPASELTPTRLGFPTEFPYEFDSPAFTSPGDSTDESSDDEEDFLAGLSRRLAPSTQRLPPPSFNSEVKRKVAATSPQSTLSGLGSYSNSGSRSPVLPPPSQSHTTSFRRDSVLDVISAAAGEVARLKLGSYEPHHLPLQNAAFQTGRQNAAFHSDRYIQQQRLLLHQMWLSSQSRIKSSELNEELAFENIRLRNMKHTALTNAALMRQHAGAPPKRPSTGTGVFLPRRYPTTTPSEPIKKPVPVNTTPMLPSKVNFDEFINVKSRSSQFDYECMLARSRLLARHGNYRAVGCLNQERRLPQDWMY